MMRWSSPSLRPSEVILSILSTSGLTAPLCTLDARSGEGFHHVLLDLRGFGGFTKAACPAIEVAHTHLLQPVMLQIALDGIKLCHGVGNRGAGGKHHAAPAGQLIHVAALGEHIRGFLRIGGGKPLPRCASLYRGKDFYNCPTRPQTSCLRRAVQSKSHHPCGRWLAAFSAAPPAPFFVRSKLLMVKLLPPASLVS